MSRVRLSSVVTTIGLLALPVLAQSVFAQSTPIRVDGNVIKGYITTLASPTLQGRRTLTPGHERSAEWAAGLFRQWGLKPAGDNGTYFQTVPILTDPPAPQPPRSFVYRLGIPGLTIGGRSFLLRDNDFSIADASTAGANVSGEVVFVGYGISAPAKGLDEYQVDVKGKIVLAFKGSPKDAPAQGGRMGAAAPPPAAAGEAWAAESQDDFKARVAYEKGAVAILLYSQPAPVAGGRGGAAAAAAMPVALAAGRGSAQPVPEPSPFKRPFVVVSNIDERVFRWIMWRDPQQAANEFNAGIDQVRRDIRDRKPRTMATGLKGTVRGYESVTLYGERFKNGTSRNVLGKIEGTDPSLKSQYVILGGHMDHMGVNNGAVLNGADDNASGTAVAMEIGRLLATNTVQPKRTIIVALWTGEEQGLIGSRYFVTHPTDGVSMDRTVGYFNMDMVGLGDRIGAPGALNFPDIFGVIMRDQDPAVASVVDARTGGPGGSDHSGFIELGIESLALMTSGGGGHPDYHQSGDDAAKIDPAILGKTGQFVLQGTLNLANETRATLLIPNRLHLYNAQALPATDLRATPAGGGRGGATGTALDARMFGGSIPALTSSAAQLSFGRVDITGTDASWFNFSSGITPQGREAVKAMEAGNLSINLVNPSATLLGDMLDATSRPFMVTVTSAAPLDRALITRMNQKNTVLLFECDPAEVKDCVTRLEGYKQQFGDSDNLVMSVKTAPADRIAAAKQALYLALINSGWTKEEIYSACGATAGGGRGGAGGNLSRLSPPGGGRGGGRGGM